jgi:hypothetical protein
VGRIGDKGGGSGKGEEMIQILYAHINKRKKGSNLAISWTANP